VLDKHGILNRLSSLSQVHLELGCGRQKRNPDAVGVDVLAHDCVDIVGDAYEVLKAFPSDSVHAVYSHHFFEHVVDIQAYMIELGRVIRPGGHMVTVTPHFSNPYYYSDPTHKTPFGLYTFSYMCRDPLFHRKVPQYDFPVRFELTAVRLIFKSPRPFYGRFVLKKGLGTLFNLNRYMREFYEENLCFMFPCYETEYHMNKLA
jgi:ubiquinone/menaquinone biosynthesis C-methylase UbiE